MEARSGDDVIDAVHNRFNSVAAPIIYVGDSSGRLPPLEQRRLRRSSDSTTSQTLFSSAESFGQRKWYWSTKDRWWRLQREHTLGLQQRCLCGGLNIIGSNNNKVNEGQCIASNTKRTQAHCDLAMWVCRRDAMNLAWLRRFADLARRSTLRDHDHQFRQTFDTPDIRRMSAKVPLSMASTTSCRL
jgi:hypothetical protein